MRDADLARIETDRLVLRPPQTEDASAIAALIDRDVARMTAGVPYPSSKALARDYVDRMQRGGPGLHRSFLIEHREMGPAGMAGFHRRERPYFELGFWLGNRFRGCGLATEAVHAAMTWARDVWGWRVVSSAHFIDNPASARVLDKAGFLHTGVIEDQFSLGRDEDVQARLMVWLA